MTQKTIFIHVALLSNWFECINKYLNFLQNAIFSKRNEETHLSEFSLYICYVANTTVENADINSDEEGSTELAPPVPLNFAEKRDQLQKSYPYIQFVHVSSNIKDYELPTLQFLYNYSVFHPNEYIYYLHTKSVGKPFNQCLEDQIQYMLYFTMERWRDCIEKLDNGADTCGVDLVDYPTLHYSGNFWWAKTNYIKSLPSPIEFSDINKYPNPLNYPNPLGSARHNQEFWVTYHRNSQHCSLWNSNISVFERHMHLYPRERYVREELPHISFTFGIVTSGENEVFLKEMIKSIHENNIPEYEIIIVGNVYFPFEKNLSIIPFDESQKPMWITRKKNLIVENAKYENVVLMHDYIVLDPSWYAGFRKFGENYDWGVNPILNLDGTRFRDYTVCPYFIEKLNDSFHQSALLPYDFKNNERINPYLYISGSYYFIKKQVAMKQPLDENLRWGQCEDLNLQERLAKDGYMISCNPYSIVRFLKQKFAVDWEHLITDEQKEYLLQL